LLSRPGGRSYAYSTVEAPPTARPNPYL